MDESKDGVEIDESFYSRQLLVLGREAMERMAKYNVLIVGLTGLGCEVWTLAVCALRASLSTVEPGLFVVVVVVVVWDFVAAHRWPRTSSWLACSL